MFLRNRDFRDRRFVERDYARILGRQLKLSNPKGLHEKLCWIKLYGITPLHRFCTDKITAPAYVDSVLGKGHTAQRYFATYDLGKLHPASIPARSCVVKANHDYNGVYLIPEVAQYDWEALRESLKKRLASNFYLAQRERQYNSIRAGILVEEMLRNSDDTPLMELKLFCFSGRVEFIALIAEGIQNKDSRRAFLDRNWNLLNVTRLRSPFVVGTLPRPAYLSEMVNMAEQLSEPFPFVRVDFFAVDDIPFVGELTFTPTAGYDIYLPDEFELAMGARLNHRDATRNWRRRLAAARACVTEAALII